MTVPILPGPFSFLAEAGQAAGAIGEVKEERKRHAEQIAEAGSNFLLQQILRGADPSVLDSPDVQKMMKTAYGFALPSSVARAIGGPERAAGAKAEADISGGVPAAQSAADLAAAKAAVPVAQAQGATAQAALDTGLPQIQARTAAATAEAQRTGAELNTSIFEGANELLGQDPRFAKLSYEAATGALDYRIRLMMIARENLTLERQQMADRARYMLEAMKMSSGLFKQVQDDYEKTKRIDMLNSKMNPDDPNSVAKYEGLHPPPKYLDFHTQFLKDVFKITPDEYARILREGIGASGVTDDQVPHGAPTPGQSTGMTASPSYQKAMSVLTTTKDAPTTGRQLADAVKAGKVDPDEVRLMFAELRRTQPAAKYKALRESYNNALGITNQDKAIP